MLSISIMRAGRGELGWLVQVANMGRTPRDSSSQFQWRARKWAGRPAKITHTISDSQVHWWMLCPFQLHEGSTGMALPHTWPRKRRSAISIRRKAGSSAEVFGEADAPYDVQRDAQQGLVQEQGPAVCLAQGHHQLLRHLLHLWEALSAPHIVVAVSSVDVSAARAVDQACTILWCFEQPPRMYRLLSRTNSKGFLWVPTVVTFSCGGLT